MDDHRIKPAPGNNTTIGELGPFISPPDYKQVAAVLRTRLHKAETLLARCEPFLPSDLVALLEEVRGFLGIDAGGHYGGGPTLPRK